jgi:hypothetical protein
MAGDVRHDDALPHLRTVAPTVRIARHVLPGDFAI